jgi:hypothetical protein
LDGRGFLAFDLVEILDALEPRASTLDWIVTDYEPTADEGEVKAFADAVYDAQNRRPRSGIALDIERLRALARKAVQTIDGQFVGVRSETSDSVEQLVNLRTFATSDAVIVVKAVDSSFWIVVTKSPEDIEAIRLRFEDVREAEATLELGLQIGP